MDDVQEGKYDIHYTSRFIKLNFTKYVFNSKSNFLRFYFAREENINLPAL